MNYEIVESNNVKYLKGVKGIRLIEDESGVVDIMGLCYEHDVDRVMLDISNLPEDFSDLKNKKAGHILGKFMTYRMKIAVVMDAGEMGSGRFGEMSMEVNRNNSLFHIFSDVTEAETWLVKG